MDTTTGLRCRECGHAYDVSPLYICEMCFGPLEVEYDYDRIRQHFSREVIATQPASPWRYQALLPVTAEPTIGLCSG